MGQENSEKVTNSLGHNIYFTADLHIRHKNILHHQKERIEKMNLPNSEAIDEHDKYIIDMVLSSTKRGDELYVLGDLVMASQQESIKILHQLKKNGLKLHLIVGNHDKSTHKMLNMFESINLIKVLNFNQKAFPFIEESDFKCVLCHYPMKSWPHKCQGSMHLYGHIHANAPWADGPSDLMLNVGLDNPQSNFKLWSLEEIYAYYKEKLGGLTPKQYIEKVSQEDPLFVR